MAATIGGTYCESPAKRARDISKLYKKYAATIETADKAQSALNVLLPSNMGHFNNVNRYLYFKGV